MRYKITGRAARLSGRIATGEAVRSVSDAEYATLAEFRSALRRFLRVSEELARACGLTPQQHQALLAIKGFPAGEQPSISQLADRLHIRHNSAVGLVDRLAKRRLVRRIPTDMDHRRIQIVLTGRAEDVLEQLTRAHRAELLQVGPQITALLRRLRRR